MEKIKELKFESNNFLKRLKSMLNVDFRRMFTTPLFYIFLGVSLAIPILVIVMTNTMGPIENASTGEMQEVEPFTNVWQAISSLSSQSSQMSMDLKSMCNTNMLYFLVAIFLCIFVGEDFRSGYSKNLFTVRAKKTDYIISKSLLGFIAGTSMIISYLIGAFIGGGIVSLDFDPGVAGISGVIMCLISKSLLMAIFIPIYLLTGVIAKQKLWLSILLSLGIGMLFYNIAPMISPLDSNIINVFISLIGGIIFSFGIGSISNLVLRKTSLI